MDEIIEELERYFGHSIPDPGNYPNSFMYYLNMYKYLKEAKQ